VSGVSALLRCRFSGTVPYAADELGYGPDTKTLIVVWQGGTGLGPSDARANARIAVIEPPPAREAGADLGRWAAAKTEQAFTSHERPNSGCACSRGRV
jgi:hypothetical protein